MISNLNRNANKNDINFLITVILTVILFAWLCTPPGNKFLQVCFWNNNVQLFIAKLLNKNENAYMFYRNNAVYIAKMYPKDKKKAIEEMNKAIGVFPSYGPKDKLNELYRERAEIELYVGNYKAALGDYLRVDPVNFLDYVKIGLLFNEIGKTDYAISYCNAFLNTEPNAFLGFACLSKVYMSMNRFDVAMNIWDLAIYRRSSNAKAYVERGNIKKALGDTEGAEEDYKKAKEINSIVDVNSSAIDDILHPKILNLSIKHDKS